LDEEAKRFAHWDDTTETDFAEKNYSVKDCIERIDEINRMSRKILGGFSDEDLERMFGFDQKDKRVEVSLRWVLHHLLDHKATHKGQIMMLKRLLRDS